MATHEKVIIIEAAAWCDQAAAMLASTIRGAPCYGVADYRREVEAGQASLFRLSVRDTRELVGYALLRVEHYAHGAEGVIVAGAGELAGGRLYPQIVPALERMFIGVKTIRVESCRRAGSRVLGELGYLPTHVVFRKPARRELRGADRLEALAMCGSEADGTGRRGTGGPDVRARPGKPYGGGGGGSSSSNSDQTTTNQDNRIVADSGGVGINATSSNVAVTVSDFGAVKAAIDLVGSTDERRTASLKDLLGAGLSVLDKAATQVEKQTALVAKAYDTAKGEGDQKTILAGAAIAAVALVAVKVFAK